MSVKKRGEREEEGERYSKGWLESGDEKQEDENAGREDEGKGWRESKWRRRDEERCVREKRECEEDGRERETERERDRERERKWR